MKNKTKIKLVNKKTKEIISRLVRAEFDKKNQTLDIAKELLLTAHVWNLPCLDSMMDDFHIEDFKLF
jgi:Sec7-like guanine-nucleotide exchange factor